MSYERQLHRLTYTIGTGGVSSFVFVPPGAEVSIQSAKLYMTALSESEALVEEVALLGKNMSSTGTDLELLRFNLLSSLGFHNATIGASFAQTYPVRFVNRSATAQPLVFDNRVDEDGGEFKIEVVISGLRY